jgi:uncharacterized protein (DUF1501 family)
MSYQLPIPGPTEPLQPYDQTAPQSARGQLAYAASDVLDLGQGLGLNPGMKGLHELWGSKDLAIVRGVGYPYPDRSHFRSMAIWQSASPQSAASTGWLGRWLDATTTNPLLALSVDSLVPPMQREAGRCVVPDRWSAHAQERARSRGGAAGKAEQ